MTVLALAHCIERLHSIIGVQVEQEAFELRDLAVLRLVNICKPVDPSDPLFYHLQLYRRHALAFVDYDHIGVGDLQMCGCHVLPLVLCLAIPFDRILIETEQDILSIDKRDDTIEVYRTTQAIIDPEKGSEIARVGETGCFEEDVVERASTGHEGFDGVDAGVFDGTADAAIG